LKSDLKNSLMTAIGKSLASILAGDPARESTGRALESFPLYGHEGLLSSIELVTLISDIEDELEFSHDIPLELFHDKAMSARNSPFRDVGTFLALIEERIAQRTEVSGE
jgi:acyl carrier protein